jgi:hypothetical protein
MLQLAYLADILSYLSHLDISLQGCDKKIFSWVMKLMLH